ncbi:putative dihydrolipoyl dehydrogenase [Helianthus annuus]|uniref:Dihydrolipoyl dehydrogenase n=1 Tax=Helianthus annuus TaxID=4232 RepID=A0A251TF74_HELAN|nr:dihydrolipoyl dehydrogenase, mitochondrial [Helianthus annuus]KAF5784554.1 putative dihydrolipoyl dehydrogenase [Helianthus annuus]KAJ0512240.1 putative dihydrolipoyl dehydrogenase [Helianthus annuus]KAJ0519669.1 putative dihydrolipoyl dehydrogenase [Helianthus annuus]KAJ0687655.1 putative dihydrolipoyl dehydrogenase [Helianthus annuus]KAJ0873210.1 putative dihydrolipoyl dehydrogenase [Helianthus annuus]
MAMANLFRRKATRDVLRYSLYRGFASESEVNDVVVIGGGPGGYVAAIKAAQLGLKTTCIEKRGALGGTCLNVGCIPSKALLHSSHLYHEAKTKFANHGVKCSDVQVDLPAMMAQKDKAVFNLTKGVEALFKKNKVNYVKGAATFLSPSQISVEEEEEQGEKKTVVGKNIIIATGSDVKGLPGITIDEKRIVSSTGALALTQIPNKLIVIGAGYIGLEMGSVWARLGSEVTVVEFAPVIVPTMDGEIRRQFQRSLEKQKMKFMLNTKVMGVDTSSSDVVKLTLEPSAGGGDQTVLEADVVLVSAGRTPYTAGLGLENIGVETDKIGRIPVDRKFSTNVKGVYAIGDVIPGPMLAHRAEDDGIAVAEFIAGKEGHVDYDKVPGVVYTHPEVASVGKTEEQVKESGVAYRVGKFPMMGNSRAKSIDDAEGLVKVIAEKETDKILGVHIMASNAGELIHEAALAISYDASSEDIARTCHAHPTLSEALKEAAMATYDKPINI